MDEAHKFIYLFFFSDGTVRRKRQKITDSASHLLSNRTLQQQQQQHQQHQTPQLHLDNNSLQNQQLQQQPQVIFFILYIHKIYSGFRTETTPLWHC